MQYQYTATNPEGKNLSGVINTNSEQEARNQLNTLGFSILELKENQIIPPAESTLTKFEFDAIDRNGKQVKGTIPAKEALLAYKRLVGEYHFMVNNLIPEDGSPTLSIQELKNQYDLEQHEKPAIEDKTSNLAEDPAFQLKKQALLEQVDLILKQVNTLLARFETKLSPEKRAEIAGTIDKLARIKSSNNLDYIRNTSKELLKKIQEDEIFLSKVTHDEERKQVLMQSQKMMMNLSTNSAIQTSLSAQIYDVLHKVEEKLGKTKLTFLLNPLKALKNWFTLEPEVEHVHVQINALRRQKWGAIKMALKSPKETRHEAWENVRTLSTQIKEARSKLHEIKHRRSDENLMVKRERHIYFLEEINTFAGWLLAFYLLYYFMGHYVTVKGLPLPPLLGIPFNLSDSVLFKYLLAFTFLLHGALSVKLNFFLRSKIASILLIPLTLILGLLVLFNI